MLTLEPTLMCQMTDSHFLNALEAEPSIMRTPVELELMRRLDLTIGVESPEDVECRLIKSYESIEEQSEFRRTLIEEIKAELDRSTGKLRNKILTLIDESYVEL